MIPHIPRRISPNLITHIGHLANLVGVVLLLSLWPEQGWPYFAAAALLQFQVWCDNADGAHARHTGQSSAYGELLDHGLDIFNVTYIGYLTAFTLGVSPLWWVLSCLLALAAVSATYWEQAETGNFVLGRLNQVEIGLLTGIMLVISGVLGRSVWTSFSLLGVTPQWLIVAWVSATLVFGIGNGIYRVQKVKGPQIVFPILVLLSFCAAVFVTWWLRVISTPVAVMLATGSNVFFAMRMLTTRFTRRSPRIEISLLGGSAGLVALSGCSMLFAIPTSATSLSVAAIACVVFGGLFVRDTRCCIKRVRSIEAA